MRQGWSPETARSTLSYSAETSTGLMEPQVPGRLWLIASLLFVAGFVALAMVSSARREAPGSPGSRARPVDPREMAGQRATQLVHASDGLSFSVDNYRLWRLDFTGLFWTPVSFPDDQLVGQVAVTPEAGSNGPIFATVTSNGFPHPLRDRRTQPINDHQRSIGVVVSWDRGLTWQPTASQPEIDGVPFRHVQEIVVSPTYAQDRTIVAFAWGPKEPSMRVPNAAVQPTALFLTRDDGASWSPIWKPDGDLHAPHDLRSQTGSPLMGHAALSTKFAQDRTLVLNIQGGLSPGSGFCFVLLSPNGGQTWGRLVFSRGYNASTACFSYPGGHDAQYVRSSSVFVGPSGSKQYVDGAGRVRELPPREPLQPPASAR